jgi:tRNA1Val (adenine37-N6)-methyltransferase
MSNQYFQFKQFRIEQGQCAMKVTTDACIQGAWTPVHNSVKRVLDIGAGTGLLSLMLAQRNPDIVIDAIELDADAAAQARNNVAVSPWQGRINIIEGDVRSYSFGDKYDLIISNPPFFKDSLLGDEAGRNMARHTLSLSYEELLKVIEANLTTGGYASVLLPSAEYQQLEKLSAAAGWYEADGLLIAHRPHAKVKRVVSVISKKERPSVEKQTLIIQDEGCNYSKAFVDLLSPFYLDL